MPEPEPMPTHLVDRINASLAAEQEQRATMMSTDSVTPLIAPTRGRRARLLIALAGAAAVVALVAVVGTTMFTARQSSSITSSASSAREGTPLGDQAPSPGSKEAPGVGSPGAGAADRSQGPNLDSRPGPAQIQIGLSGSRYTQAGFVVQAEALRRSAPGTAQPQAANPSSLGPAATVSGLKECLNAIGAGDPQVVRADVALYNGEPAVIILVTTNSTHLAFVVGLQCSGTDRAVLRPATLLP